MRRIFVTLLLIAGLTATVLYAADFWEQKEFAEWTDKEVQKMLTNSPWSKMVEITIGARIPGGRGGGGGGGGAMGGGGGGGMSGAGGGGGRRGGGGGGGGGDMPMPTMKFHMRWASALPVRQAMVRSRFGNEVGSEAAQKILNMEDDRYILAVIGLPRAMLRGGSGGGGGRGGGGQRQAGQQGERQAPPPADFEALKSRASLKIKGAEPIHPTLIEGTAEGGPDSEIYMFFPKAKDGGFDISADTKDIEFELKTRNDSIKRKFKLKDMVFNGKLEI